jgi:O-acetyl-ADP-ribose deacetylase (regulator of RNase III)
MPIRYVAGDLFANEYQARALAHGCNCQGTMGAGIAVGFRERYPAMYAAYRQRCQASPRQFNPGDVFLWKADNQPWVFNLATQEDYWRSRAYGGGRLREPGSRTLAPVGRSRAPATYDAIERCLNAMRARADAEGIASIAMPRIGAGYGGLSWPKVRAIIERAFADWAGSLYVYETYQAASQPAKPAT